MRNLIVSLFALLLLGGVLLTPPSRPQPKQSFPHQTVPSGTNEFRQVDQKNLYFLSLDTIKPIICATIPKEIAQRDIMKLTPEEGKKVELSAGTGTIISHNRVLTASHVITGASVCFVDQKVVKVTYDSPEMDIAVLDVDLGETPVTTIACDEFVVGRTYLAFGYARGRDFALNLQTFAGFLDVPITDGAGSTAIRTHMGIFEGGLTPGMSGGPVIAPDGRLYGVISATNGQAGILRQLADTELCTALKSAPAPAAETATPKTADQQAPAG